MGKNGSASAGRARDLTAGKPTSKLRDRQPQPAPDGVPLHCERHRPEQTTLYRLVQQHAAGFIAHTEASTGAELPRFIKAEPGHKQSSGLFVPGEGPGHWPDAACKAEFDTLLECGILPLGVLRLRCGECGQDKLLAAQPELVTPVLQVVQRVVTCHLPEAAGLETDEDHGSAVSPIQRFGSAANLHIHLHCLVLDGVYQCDADGLPSFIEVSAPSDEAWHALLQTIIARLMQMLTRRGVLVQDMGQAYLAESDADGEEARTLRPLQATAITYRIAFGPRAGQKVLTLGGARTRRVLVLDGARIRTLKAAAADLADQVSRKCKWAFGQRATCRLITRPSQGSRCSPWHPACRTCPSRARSAWPPSACAPAGPGWPGRAGRRR